MEYFPLNLIILWKKKILLYFKMERLSVPQSRRAVWMREHPRRLLFSSLPHFPQSFLPPHVQHRHLTIFFVFSTQSKIRFPLLSGTQWNSFISLPPPFLRSPNILFFIQSTPAILPLCSPSMCQSCLSNSFCTCPSPSLGHSFPRSLQGCLALSWPRTFPDHPS